MYRRYRDPDAEQHPEYDLNTAAHNAIIEQRAIRRGRLFRRSQLGERRPLCRGAAVSSSASGVPAPCEMLVVPDEEPDEWEAGHIPRREELVQSFMIAWDKGEAEWLQYPDKEQRRQAALRSPHTE
jgi:hypothetical protein